MINFDQLDNALKHCTDRVVGTNDFTTWLEAESIEQAGFIEMVETLAEVQRSTGAIAATAFMLGWEAHKLYGSGNASLA